ncbi:MAG: DUF4286 family protein [Weeksellaceae bacterium]|nr:DUF4286 family protein [Weeksellaceae bacterium]
MIIYNVTISIHQDVEIQWLEWMKTKHIQEVLDTGCFTSARFTRIRGHDDPNSSNYSVQYMCNDNKLLKQYYEIHAPKLRDEGLKLFGDKMLTFRTELELISEFFGNRS